MATDINYKKKDVQKINYKKTTCRARVRATGYGLYSHYLRVEAEAVPTLAIMG